MKAIGKFRAVMLAGFACLSFQFLTLECDAEIYTLSDGNSIAQINPRSQAGMYNWSVNGQNQLYQQWFWYRVGPTGPEQSIDTISEPAVTQIAPNTLNTVYSYEETFSVKINYTLNGTSPASGISDIGEQITIHNFTAAPLDFHFFQYSDFDLLGFDGGDSVDLGTNRRGLYNDAYQVDGVLALTETTINPGANRGEVALYNATLLKLNDNVASTLDNNAGPVGPGDVTWALQWDVSIPANGDFLISKDKYLSVVPEPTSLSLLLTALLGLAGLDYLRRRRRS
jgi:hypothetical protein